MDETYVSYIYFSKKLVNSQKMIDQSCYGPKEWALLIRQS